MYFVKNICFSAVVLDFLNVFEIVHQQVLNICFNLDLGFPKK